MGCHTWFYKKVKDVNRNILIEDIIEKINELIPEYENEPDPADQGFLVYIKSLKDLLEEAINNHEVMSDEEVEEYYHDIIGGVIHIHNNALYSEKDVKYHDVFRKYGYPDDVLTSYEETIAYIEDPENEVMNIQPNYKEQLKQFWNEFPDGIITFG